MPRRLNLEVDGEKQILEESESTTVSPEPPHRYWYENDEQVRATLELRPPGNFEMFFETVYGLAKAGKVNAAGVPNLAPDGRYSTDFASSASVTFSSATDPESSCQKYYARY